MDVTVSPADFRALIAETRPIPGPLTITPTSRKPACEAFLAVSSADFVAAYGVDFRDPLNPDIPELPVYKELPSKSVIVIRVLLKPAVIYTRPADGIFFCDTFFAILFSRHFLANLSFNPPTVFFLPFLVRALVRVR